MPLTKRVKKKKKNPSPAESETSSYASGCVETDCTVVLILLGFGLRFRKIKNTDDVQIFCLLKMHIVYIYAAVCM